MDDAQIICEALGIHRTAEFILFDPSSFTVIERGSLNDETESILKSMVAGWEFTTPENLKVGQPINYAAANNHRQHAPAYEQDIAPIIEENCASCHRESGIAPFAVDSYSMIRGWSPMIREVVMTKRMPPGQIDPHIGSFENDMLLIDSEQQTLLHCIEAGAPRDATTDPLARLSWPES